MLEKRASTSGMAHGMHKNRCYVSFILHNDVDVILVALALRVSTSM